MSAENDLKRPHLEEQQTQEPEHHLSQAERDQEIEAIQQHSKHQHAGIERPPELPPAPPRKALLIVGLALLALLIAGAFTLLERSSHNRALARETEQNSVRTVNVVHPAAEKPDTELVLPGSLLAFKESSIFARTN